MISKTGRINSIRAAARLYEIPYITLAGRAKGVKVRDAKPLNRRKLT
jgi:hypothetical protein